jgi:hypothetical protein
MAEHRFRCPAILLLAPASLPAKAQGHRWALEAARRQVVFRQIGAHERLMSTDLPLFARLPAPSGSGAGLIKARSLSAPRAKAKAARSVFCRIAMRSAALRDGDAVFQSFFDPLRAPSRLAPPLHKQAACWGNASDTRLADPDFRISKGD